jgi:hypothetical protein
MRPQDVRIKVLLEMRLMGLSFIFRDSQSED